MTQDTQEFSVLTSYVVKSVPVGSAGTYRAYLVGDITLGPSGVVQMVKNTAIATFYPD